MDKLISSHFTCINLEYILYQKDMTSPMHYFQAASAGQRDREAANFLEKKMKNNPSLTFQETIEVRVFLFIESKLDEGMQDLLWMNRDRNHVIYCP